MTKDIAVKSFGVFGIETETFKYYTDKLQGCDFYSHGRFITANFNTEHESYLYMAIPYDKGLTAYINGKKTTLYKVNDSFPEIGCSEYEVREGDHIQWLYSCDLGKDVGKEGWKK